MMKKVCVFMLVIALIFAFVNTRSFAEEQVIRFICSAGGSGKAFQGGLEKFNEANKGKYRVEVDMVAWEALQEKEMFQFISGTATYDVLSIVSNWLPGMKPYLEPIDGYIEQYGPDVVSLFGEGAIEAGKYEGKIVALPIRTGGYIIYYRKDLFDQAGLTPPQTMEEYIDAARKLTKRAADGTVERYGTSLKLQSPAWTVEAFVNFFMPLGGYLLTEDLKHASPSLKSQLAIDVLNTMKTLQDEKLIPEPLAWTYDDNVVALQTDKVAFSFEYSARALLMEDPEKSKVVGKMAYAAFPPEKIGTHPSSSYFGTWSFGIDKNSPNKEAAYQLIKHMTSLETQKFLALEWKNGPTVLGLYDDPEYQKINQAAPAIKEALSTMPRDWAPVPENPQIMMVVHEEIQAFMLGRQDAKQTGENMYDRIEEIMTEK
jgi:ABC-type glycerol-3-phosphate transport system substrate-binding protein